MKNHCKNILVKLGLCASEKDENLKNMIRQSYESLCVIGNNGISINPMEVRNSIEFKEAILKAKKIVNNHK